MSKANALFRFQYPPKIPPLPLYSISDKKYAVVHEWQSASLSCMSINKTSQVCADTVFLIGNPQPSVYTQEIALTFPKKDSGENFTVNVTRFKEQRMFFANKEYVQRVVDRGVLPTLTQEKPITVHIDVRRNMIAVSVQVC
jgi:hypothetical protein